MTPEIGTGGSEKTPAETATRRHDRRVEILIDRLPNRIQPALRWLRRPASWWVRVPVGVLLVVGGILSILPFLGLWMLPLGLMLLAVDFPPLRRMLDLVLDWIERRRPLWFAGGEAPGAAASSHSTTHSPAARLD
jgi:hypothetical protein